METLPLFPNFRPITLDDREWYDAFYVQFPPYADFSFSNLLIWLNQRDDLALAQLSGNVILRCTNLYMGDQVMFNILGNTQIDETIDTIFAFQQESGLKQGLLGVPDFVLNQIRDITRFEVFDDRDNYEYILDARALADLEGPSFKRLRQYVHTYANSADSPAQVEQLDLADPNVAEYLRTNMNKWGKAFTTNDSASQERQVMDRTFELASKLGYENMSILVDGELVGFMIFQSKAYQSTVVANHLKSSYQYHNTSYYMTHQLARILSSRGINYINYEQDLGILGLRDFKMKLRPHHLLPKYNLTPKTHQ